MCFVLAVLTQQRGEGENEAAKVHIAIHERQLSKMSGRKERKQVVFAQALSLQEAVQCILGTWQIERQRE